MPRKFGQLNNTDRSSVEGRDLTISSSTENLPVFLLFSVDCTGEGKFSVRLVVLLGALAHGVALLSGVILALLGVNGLGVLDIRLAGVQSISDKITDSACSSA